MNRKRLIKYYCTGCSKTINYPNVVKIDGKLIPHCPKCKIEVKGYMRNDKGQVVR